MERYNKLNEHLKNIFGERVLKICIDGGFSCPNRDGTKSTGGCAFCTGRGSGDHLKPLSITEQIENHISSYRGERANKYIVYFQSFSNTYAPLDVLKARYDEALSASSKIVGLSVATRPDLVTKEIVELLSTYKKDHHVSVELGLQTINPTTMHNMNLCYTKEDFINAVKLLKEKEIDVVAHIMIGLPNETIDDTKQIVDFLNSLTINGIKIHSTYVAKGTALEKMYNENSYSPISLEDYLFHLEYIITHLKKDVVIHRLSGDAPKDLLVAPMWNKNKKPIINGIHKLLEEKNLIQGIFYQN